MTLIIRDHVIQFNDLVMSLMQIIFLFGFVGKYVQSTDWKLNKRLCGFQTLSSITFVKF